MKPNPIAPGVPHSNTEDDEYDGYFLPKGTMFLPNIWFVTFILSSHPFGLKLNRAMMHDPEVFERPFDFMPERYLKDGKLDLTVPDGDLATFGFGRR
jgi:cytochrome P450